MILEYQIAGCISVLVWTAIGLWIILGRRKKVKIDVGPPFSLTRLSFALVLVLAMDSGVAALLLKEGSSNQSVLSVVLLYDDSIPTMLLRYGVAINYLIAVLLLVLPKVSRK